MKSRLLLAFLMPLFAGCSPLCGNDVSQTLNAPDGTHQAVIFSRDCGATTDFSTQISVLGALEPLPDESGNVLVLDGSQNVVLRWQNAKTLVIVYPQSVRSFNKQTLVNGVSIVFK